MVKQKTPDYRAIVLEFTGTMDEWNTALIQLHNEHGTDFQYESMEDALLNLIEEALPDSKAVINAVYVDSESMVAAIQSKFEHRYIDMLFVCNEQNGEYWSGQLHRTGLLVTRY